MERIGIVTVVEKDNSGVIEDAGGNEFYFHLNGCLAGRMPREGQKVKFKKDPDLKLCLGAIDVETLEGV